MDTVKIIKTKADHEAALARLDYLMDLDPAPNLDEDLELSALAAVIELYETRENFFPTDHITALDIIKFHMEQNDLTPKDMRQYLGSSSKVSEVLSGKRPLSLTMMRKLHKGLNISADILLEG